MDVQTPSPQTTLAILLGASEWPQSPEFPGSKAFAHAISSFRSYLFDPRRFGLPKENALDLFDVDDSPHIINRKIRHFLEQRTLEMELAGNGAKDLLLYFVGHGGFVGRNSDYYLAVRCTSTEDPGLSGIPMESLALTLTDKARYLRRIIILDCCYAAAAFTSFQAEGPAKLGIDQTFHAFEKKAKAVGKGTALLCSSGRTVASQIAQDQSCTMFSKALLQVLFTGDERQQEQHYFSLREVADLTEEVITRELEGKAPRPEIHSPDQKEGDVAPIPFFPNPARGVVPVPSSSPGTRHSPNQREENGAIAPLYSYPASGEAGVLQNSDNVPTQDTTSDSVDVSLQESPHPTVRISSPPVKPPASALPPTAYTPSPSTASAPPSTQRVSISPLIGTLIYTYTGPGEMRIIAWSPDGKRIASGGNNTVEVWDATDGGNAYIFDLPSMPRSVAWSPDGKRIASGNSDGTVWVWDTTDGGNVFQYKGHTKGSKDTKYVNAVAWSPDGKHIASGGNTVQVWNAIDGTRVFQYKGQSGCLAWSPDGKRIAFGNSDGTVQVWDAIDGARIFQYKGHTKGSKDTKYVNAVAWSPDGKHIASAGEDTVQVWNAKNGKIFYIYRGHVHTHGYWFLFAVAWSPDGKRIASAGKDNTVQVWDVIDGGNVYTYSGHTTYQIDDPLDSRYFSGVCAVAWSPDGTCIASGGADHTVRVWSAV